MKNSTLSLADIAEPHCRSLRTRAGWRWLRRSFWHNFFPRDMMRQVRRGGLVYRVSERKGHFRRIVRDGSFNRPEIVYFFNAARDSGSTILLDVGANFGYYSLLAARLGLFSQIHALEPQPSNHRRLLWHIEANGMQDAIAPYPIAASDLARTMYMNDVDDVSSVRQTAAEKADIAVEAAPLDSLFNFRGENIAMKVDVEGHEVSVLQGAEQLMRDNNMLMQVESLGAAAINYLITRGFELVHYSGWDFYFVRPAQSEATAPARTGKKPN